jgi:hypothetical protein
MEAIWPAVGLAVVWWLFWRALHRERRDQAHDKMSDPLSFHRTVPRFLFSKEDTAGPLTYDVRIRSKAAPPKG